MKAGQQLNAKDGSHMADWHFRGLDLGVGERFFMVFRGYHSYATWGFHAGRGFLLTEAPQRGRVNLQSGSAAAESLLGWRGYASFLPRSYLH